MGYKEAKAKVSRQAIIWAVAAGPNRLTKECCRLHRKLDERRCVVNTGPLLLREKPPQALMVVRAFYAQRMACGLVWLKTWPRVLICKIYLKTFGSQERDLGKGQTVAAITLKLECNSLDSSCFLTATREARPALPVLITASQMLLQLGSAFLAWYDWGLLGKNINKKYLLKSMPRSFIYMFKRLCRTLSTRCEGH